MSDELIAGALGAELAAHQGAGLWLLDEHPLDAVSPLPQGLTLVSNRRDVADRWPECIFSDFDLAGLADGSLDAIYYRVSKEKAVVHHIINQAARLLRPGGRLWLAGGKQEGTRTYFAKGRARLGDGTLHKLGKGALLAELVRSGEVGEPLDDSDYPRLRALEVEGEGFWSKPGLFGWDKIDQGSRFLVAQLGVVWSRLPARPRVLDLGCGWGYLALHCARRGAGRVVATDNNAAALLAARRNLDGCGAYSEVVAADVADRIDERFDLVICNPPFHQGFAVQGSLTDRFLAAAADHLLPGGQAAFVVNAFIPLERKAAARFGEIDTFADNGRFKLVRLARPR